jgi:hypothetical protein
VLEVEGVQNSTIVLHCLQILQPTFSGQGLSDSDEIPAAGGFVPGTRGPPMVTAISARIGGALVPKQTAAPYGDLVNDNDYVAEFELLDRYLG